MNWNEELEKCKKSPYYFATKYLTVNGKPFTTLHSEEEFNKFFNNTKPVIHGKKRVRVFQR